MWGENIHPCKATGTVYTSKDSFCARAQCCTKHDHRECPLALRHHMVHDAQDTRQIPSPRRSTKKDTDMTQGTNCHHAIPLRCHRFTVRQSSFGHS